MADEGYWRAKAHRAPKPALAVGLIALTTVATVVLGVILAEWLSPMFAGLPHGFLPGSTVTEVIFEAIALGLAASAGGLAILEGLARLRNRARPEAWAFLLLAPAGVAGALGCAFLLPGSFDDRLTEARIADSWGHYVDTVRFDEGALERQYAMLDLGSILDRFKLEEPKHWEASAMQIKLAHELIAKYRGYELYRRDEALKTVDEGNLRPEARAKARQRILDGYAVLAPLFDSRWDILDARIVEIEKGAKLLQASRGAWRVTAEGMEFSNRAQLAEIRRIVERDQDLESQEQAVACKLNRALGLHRPDCDIPAMVRLVPEQR